MGGGGAYLLDGRLDDRLADAGDGEARAAVGRVRDAPFLDGVDLHAVFFLLEGAHL